MKNTNINTNRVRRCQAGVLFPTGLYSVYRKKHISSALLSSILVINSLHYFTVLCYTLLFSTRLYCSLLYCNLLYLE